MITPLPLSIHCNCCLHSSLSNIRKRRWHSSELQLIHCLKRLYDYTNEVLIVIIAIRLLVDTFIQVKPHIGWCRHPQDGSEPLHNTWLVWMYESF